MHERCMKDTAIRMRDVPTIMHEEYRWIENRYARWTHYYA